METLFISRAGADVAASERIAEVLERAGYRVILQQRNFANKSFMEQMQSALDSGARVIGLLSPAYLASDYCSAEWQSVLADDPLNKQSRLIILRITECKPAGLLRALAYWDLVHVADAQGFERLVLEAVGQARPFASNGEPAAPEAPPAAQGLTVPATPADRPAPEGGAGNLPPQLTAFIGRAQVVNDIRSAIERTRLVTLLGAGGIGKTRTALEVAGTLQPEFRDGTWFADFAPINGAYVVPAIAAVLDVHEERGIPLIDSVVAKLKTQHALVILDNCEHVVAEARAVAATILQQCPHVHLIATTREALGVGGEVVLRVPTLGVPAFGEALAAADADRYEAIALFATRARAADERFMVTDANVGIVGEICRRLDGIALAIELAAARIKLLNVTQLAAKLDERFRLLTGGSKSALPRQQTMRALIDWSYDLLDPRERHLFRRLSIFAGGWTLDAALAVCADADADEFEILDVLTSLVDKSLVVVDFAQEAKRFRFLESMRAYALERMRGEGEFEELARRRKAFFADFAGDGVTIGTFVLTRSAAIQAELENLREVLAWTLEDGHDVETGARIAFALGRFWSMRFPLEGQRWLRLAQTKLAANADASLVANVALAAAALMPHGTGERMQATEHALALSRLAGDPLVLSRALGAYGDQLTPLLRLDEAQAALDESFEQARNVGSAWDQGRALTGLTALAAERLDLDAMRRLGNQGIAIFESIGAIDGVAHICNTLGQMEFGDGHIERAIALIQRARVAQGELHNDRGAAFSSNFLAYFSLELGKLADARDHARDALALQQTDRHPYVFAESIGLLGHIATQRGDPQRGALLYGYADAAFKTLTFAQSRGTQTSAAHHLQQLTETLGPETVARLLGEGALLTEERALQLALAV